MSAAGKKNTLAMKDPAKPWPFGPATRAGQDATAVQVIANAIHQRASRILPAFLQNAHACCRTAAPAPGTRSRAATSALLASANFHGCAHQTPPGRGEQGTLVPTSGGLAPGSSGTAVLHPRLRCTSVQAQSRPPRVVVPPLCPRGAYSGLVSGMEARAVKATRGADVMVQGGDIPPEVPDRNRLQAADGDPAESREPDQAGPPASGRCRRLARRARRRLEIFELVGTIASATADESPDMYSAFTSARVAAISGRNAIAFAPSMPPVSSDAGHDPPKPAGDVYEIATLSQAQRRR